MPSANSLVNLFSLTCKISKVANFYLQENKMQQITVDSIPGENLCKLKLPTDLVVYMPAARAVTPPTATTSLF